MQHRPHAMQPTVHATDTHTHTLTTQTGTQQNRHISLHPSSILPNRHHIHHNLLTHKGDLFKMSSSSDRLNEACSLLIQSPPGQTSQVYHDLRGILFDAESNAADKIGDAKLQAAAAVALEEYNTQQLVTASLDSSAGSDAAVIICQRDKCLQVPKRHRCETLRSP